MLTKKQVFFQVAITDVYICLHIVLSSWFYRFQRCIDERRAVVKHLDVCAAKVGLKAYSTANSIINPALERKIRSEELW